MLVLERPAYDEVIDHAEAAAPREACGILAGRRVNGRQLVVTVHRTENVSETPRLAYEMNPGEQLQVMETVEAADRSILGFYHSHPTGPPGPSGADENRATWPDHHYVVVGLGRPRPTFDAWLWTGDTFVPSDVSITQ